MLTGFMGTGKTTVGQAVAVRLDRPFVDMDTVIVERAGQTIPEIFAAAGEAAFRRLERQVCLGLARRQGLVIATGGGALVDLDSRRAMINSGLVICLTAAPAVIIERLRSVSDRPLLHTPDPAKRIRELLAARAAAYEALPHHLDTTDLTPEATVEAVMDIWHRQSFP